MIVSRNLLAEFFPGIKDVSIEELYKALFKSGIEIELFEKLVGPTGVYYGVIKKVEKVKKSDKLNLCQVFIPVKNEIFSIVCGASNVREGLRIVAALPGAKLGGGKINIEERIFSSWGITSQGMICSYTELFTSNILKNISNFEKGKIIELGENWDINREFSSVDFWLDDWVFDLALPANRGDLHSIWGLSRELAKVFGKSKSDLGHGGSYSKDQDPWILKRVLLVNNQGDIGDDFQSNIDRYAYLAFNEVDRNSKLPVRKKSGYFKNLREGFLSSKVVQDFKLNSIEIDKENILLFIGIDKNLDINNDFFVLENRLALIPEWRNDAKTERDIVDEVMIFIGWEELNSSPIKSFISTTQGQNKLVLALEKIREFWRNIGFYECTTFNLHKKNIEEITVSNPLSNDYVSLRTNAINELIEVIRKNYQEKKELHPIFEIFEAQYPEPTWTLNILVPENIHNFPLNKTRIFNDLYDLQSLIKKSMRYVNANISFSKTEAISPFLKTNYLSIDDLGGMGYLDSSIPIKLWGAYCKIYWSEPNIPQIKHISKFPPSYKDISIEMNRDKTVGIGDILRELNSKDLDSVVLIEKYEEEQFISYLIRVKLQSKEKTLTGDDIQRNMNELISILENKFEVKIR